MVLVEGPWVPFVCVGCAKSHAWSEQGVRVNFRFTGRTFSMFSSAACFLSSAQAVRVTPLFSSLGSKRNASSCQKAMRSDFTRTSSMVWSKQSRMSATYVTSANARNFEPDDFEQRHGTSTRLYLVLKSRRLEP